MSCLVQVSHEKLLIYQYTIDSQPMFTFLNQILPMTYKIYIYRVVQKNEYPGLFGDNFGNSALILTILSLLQTYKFMTRKSSPPTTPLLCDHIT